MSTNNPSLPFTQQFYNFFLLKELKEHSDFVQRSRGFTFGFKKFKLSFKAQKGNKATKANSLCIKGIEKCF